MTRYNMLEKGYESVKYSNLINNARTVGEVIDFVRLIFPGKTSQPTDFLVVCPDGKKYLIDHTKPREYEHIKYEEIVKVSVMDKELGEVRARSSRIGWVIKVYTRKNLSESGADKRTIPNKFDFATFAASTPMAEVVGG